jgi:coenzyme F420-0:L-glutamate ligase/coenzyme F420-1:gamma-L-glutamate ligase
VELHAFAIEGLPELTAGADLASALIAALASGPAPRKLEPGDILALAHKAISKCEGQIRRLADVTPGARALELAATVQKDPRHVQVILDESSEVLRAVPGVLIVQTHHGFVCANAGVDGSNAPEDGTLVLLPRDPDRSARELRARLRELTGVAPGVLISDSFGRAWRTGQVDVAIGAAGVTVVHDWRGEHDARGHELHATMIAVADELVAAADLTRAKDSQQPAVLIRGAGRYVSADDGSGVMPLIRERARDLFR